MARLTLDKVKEEIKENGFEYVDGQYSNLKSPLTVKCEHGHTFPISLEKLRRKPKCPTCESYKKLEEEEQIMHQVPPKNGVRILALDNATKISGYAIFEGEKLIEAGIKKMGMDDDTIFRIAEMKQWLLGMINLWEIDVIGLEGVQYQGNAQTLIVLSKLLGVLENTSFEMLESVPYIVPSGTWRKYCKIKGRTRAQKKEGAQNYVKEKFGIVASQDKADAICLGDYLASLERYQGGWTKE